MTPHATLLSGDSSRWLQTLPSGSAQCCVTSPVYWNPDATVEGPTEGVIGLEATMDDYVAALVALFGEVRRVLDPTGALFIVIGSPRSVCIPVPAPSLLALALEADGWILQREIVWDAGDSILVLTPCAQTRCDVQSLPRVISEPRRKVEKGCGFTPLPDELVRVALRSTTSEGDLVLDPFCGCGTVGVIAASERRNFIGIEISEPFLDITAKRLAEEGATVTRSLWSAVAAATAFASKSDCGGYRTSNRAPLRAYLAGRLGFDFATPARRDSFVQAGLTDPENPENLIAFLHANPSSSADIQWTLERGGIATHVIVPSGPFAATMHARFPAVLAAQLQDPSIAITLPGWLAGASCLSNGAEVPVVHATLRGTRDWHLTSSPLEELLWNAGLLPWERALNFAIAGTDAVRNALDATARNDYALASTDVVRSPICRPKSDCWDVVLTFFDPARRLTRAIREVRITIDVSDVVPVVIGRPRVLDRWQPNVV